MPKRVLVVYNPDYISRTVVRHMEMPGVVFWGIETRKPDEDIRLLDLDSLTPLELLKVENMVKQKRPFPWSMFPLRFWGGSRRAEKSNP